LPLLVLYVGFIRFMAFGQENAPAAVQAQQTSPPPVQQAPPPAASPKSTAPDYPDPRTFTIGAFYWFTGPGTNPGLFRGRGATDNETLSDLGKPKFTPGVQVSFPITRTGELKFEGFVTKGDGNQIAVNDPFLLGTQFSTGQLLASQYQIADIKFYLDDLLFPHKFPVARFRLKSLWEVQYTHIKTTIDAPLVTSGLTANATKQLVLPTFGIAAEYALSPHVLFRVAGSGFGIYHGSDIWDAEATISWRRGQFELLGGGKAFHFKTSPNDAEYYSATFAGGFAGARWHF
jgi:hypothetical protein